MAWDSVHAARLPTAKWSLRTELCDRIESAPAHLPRVLFSTLFLEESTFDDETLVDGSEDRSVSFPSLAPRYHWTVAAMPRKPPQTLLERPPRA